MADRTRWGLERQVTGQRIAVSRILDAGVRTALLLALHDARCEVLAGPHYLLRPRTARAGPDAGNAIQLGERDRTRYVFKWIPDRVVLPSELPDP